MVTRVELRDGEIHKTVNMPALFIQSSFNPIFAVFYFLLVLLLGVWTTTTMVDRWKKTQSTRRNTFCKKMTRVVCCNSVLMSGNLMFLVVVSLLLILSPVEAMSMLLQAIIVTFTSDLFTLAMPYILLLFDSNIRRKFGLEHHESPTFYSIYPPPEN
ncbi:unnamed protein product [Caenorhabditis sp. 36 PRJEB53466]|nr:unnamed protein product [Caenorhabditis sp. 36 PRJEB53466]